MAPVRPVSTALEPMLPVLGALGLGPRSEPRSAPELELLPKLEVEPIPPLEVEGAGWTRTVVGRPLELLGWLGAGLGRL